MLNASTTTQPRLEARIHRGATEIGGNCLELRSQGHTILLDLGASLDESNPHLDLPAAIGIGEPGPDPLGVFISHGHRDHWGLVPKLDGRIPVWIGRGASDVLRAAAFWGTGVDLKETGHLQDQSPITVGPFTITPYLADHSGFDAYSLLIEADGRRLFYSGDFRGHGRKAGAFARLLAAPPRDIHALVMEATSLRSDAGDETVTASWLGPSTETDVELDLAETLRATDGTVVVLGSPQNVDRLVTTYRAALRADRDLVVDVYSAEVAAASGRPTIPAVGRDWPRVWAYLPSRERSRIIRSREFDRVAAVRSRRAYDETLRSDPARWVVFGSFTSEVPRWRGHDLHAGGAVVWSMWDGYLCAPSGARLRVTGSRPRGYRCTITTCRGTRRCTR